MITITKEDKGNVIIVKLSGSLVDQEDLVQLIGQTDASKKLTFNCRQLSRINSTGTRAWLNYFRGLQTQGIVFSFSECSTVVVEQLNFFRNFNCGGKIESVYTPYICEHCNTESHVLFSTNDLIKLQPTIPNVKCPKCGEQAEFDDIPEQYFRFLKDVKT